MAKLKVATGILQGCFGCHMALLDLHEDLIPLLVAIDIVRSPINDVKEVPEVDLGILDGSVCNTENEALAKEFRKKSKKILALGTCAYHGRHQRPPEPVSISTTVLKRSYVKNESTVEGIIPESPDIPQTAAARQGAAPGDRRGLRAAGVPAHAGHDHVGALMDIINNARCKIAAKNLCHECTRDHEQMYIPAPGVRDRLRQVHHGTGRDQRGTVLPGAGRPLHGAGDERRMRSALRQGKHAVQGLHGTRPRRAGAGREDDQFPGLGPAGRRADVHGRRGGGGLPVFAARIHLSAQGGKMKRKIEIGPLTKLEGSRQDHHPP